MLLRQDFNRRHSPNRRKTCVPALLHVDGAVLEVMILDVSYEGMKLAAAQPLEPGTAVTIEMLEVRIPAIVHWYADGVAGIHLLERLARDVLVALETADDDLAEYR